MNVAQVENLSIVHSFQNQYAIYRTSDGKEGIITLDGEIILPAKKYVSILPLCDHLFDLVTKDLQHITFDAIRQEILPLSLCLKGGEDHYIFSQNANGTTFWQKDDQFGICDSQCRILLPAEYEKITFYAGKYWLKKANRWMVLNKKLEKCFSDVEDVRLLIGAKAKNDAVAVAKDGAYYLLSANGERLTKEHYDYLQPFTEDGYAIAKIDGKLVVIDENEQVLCRTKQTITYDDSQTYPYWRFMWVSANRLAFYEAGKYGLMTPTGNVIVPPTYAEITVLGYQNLIPVKSTEGLCGYIDVEGKIVVPCRYKFVTFKKAINQFLVRTIDNKYGLLDRIGNPVLPAIYKQITVDQDGRLFMLLS